MAQPKHTFAGRLRDAAQNLATAVTQLRNLGAVYADRGYAPGGSDPIITADVADLSLTGPQVHDMLALADQLVNYMDTSARRALLSRFRNDL